MTAVRTNNPGGGRSFGPRRPHAAPDRAALATVEGKITALEPQRAPQRRSVFVDGQFVLGLHEETILLLKLRVGQTVDGHTILEALDRDRTKQAWDAALLLLGATSRTQAEIARKLAGRFGPEVAADVVQRLVAGGWLNDEEYARSYVRSHADHGPLRLARDLDRRGVAREMAALAITQEIGTVDAVEQARAVAAQRLARMGAVDRQAAERRLGGFLSRRGFGFETIRQALTPLLASLPRPVRDPAHKPGVRPSRWGRRGQESAVEEGSE